jgi:hypothetical protein
VVSHLNLWRMAAVESSISAWVQFTGIRPNWKKEGAVAFREYVEAY